MTGGRRRSSCSPASALRSARIAPSCGPATSSSRSCSPGCRRLDRRHPDDRRHRALDAVREPSTSSRASPVGLLLRHGLGSALLGRRPAPAAREGQFGLHAAAVGHALHLRSSPCWSRCRSACSRRSTCPSTPAAACARSSSRCWRSWPASRPSSTASSPLVTFGPFLRDLGVPSIGLNISAHQRAHRRLRHGHHADPVRLLAVRRHHQRRAAVAARRLLRARRHPVRDHQAASCSRPRCPASSARCCWRPRAPSARP